VVNLRARRDHQKISEYPHRLLILALSLLLIPILGSLSSTHSPAQLIGEQAEMDRLEQQADDLAAQGDPEGAALAIGKAAMMADILTKDSYESSAEEIFKAAAFAYRAQELGLRALALFERAGGNPPAPAGVCHYLVQGNKKLRRSKELLLKIPVMKHTEMKDRGEHFLEKNKEWKILLQILHEDFECSDPFKKK